MWTGAQYCYPEMFLLAFFELKVLSVPNVKQMFWLPHSINTFPNFNHKVSTHTEGSIVFKKKRFALDIKETMSLNVIRGV